jgi:hypothetical protein
MNLKKNLALLVMSAAACVTPGFAQIYWSNHSTPGITDDIGCVTYANGVFAAVTNQGNLLTSTDGLTWSSQSIDKGVWLDSVAYGNGTWVVVGDKGAMLESADLKTWVTVTPATNNKLNCVLYNGNVFIAVGDSGTIITSQDALTWKVQSVPAGVTGSLRGITYSPSYNVTPYCILVAGDNGTLLAGYYDGSGFISASSGTSQNLEAALFPMAGQSPPFLTVVVGVNGTIINDGYGTEWVAGSGGTWASAGSANTSSNLRSLVFGSGYFVAAGDQGTILTSMDGKSWTQRFSGDSPSTISSASLLGAAYSPTLQRFVVTGTGGTILVSNSTPTVLGNVSTRGFVSSNEIFIGGFVIEGASPRTVLIRADGPTLGAFSVPNSLPDPVLTVYDSKGNVIATNAGWTTNPNPATISNSAQVVGAFALPNLSADSALLLTLQPGAYTAQVTSAKGNSGIVLFEAYTD